MADDRRRKLTTDKIIKTYKTLAHIKRPQIFFQCQPKFLKGLLEAKSCGKPIFCPLLKTQRAHDMKVFLKKIRSGQTLTISKRKKAIKSDPGDREAILFVKKKKVLPALQSEGRRLKISRSAPPFSDLGLNIFSFTGDFYPSHRSEEPRFRRLP